MDLNNPPPSSPTPPLENGASVNDTDPHIPKSSKPQPLPVSAITPPPPESSAKSLSTSKTSTTTSMSPAACADPPSTLQNTSPASSAKLISPSATPTPTVGVSPGSLKTPEISTTPSNTNTAPLSNTTAMPLSSSKPSVSSPASSPPGSEPASATTQNTSIARTRSFKDLAQRVILQVKIKKADEEQSFEEEEEEEDLPFEELEEKAKGGDAKAQCQLGKYYLKLATEKDEEVNNQLAVEWLVQSAKLGRKDASKYLQRCWIQRKGITPENEVEVRKLSTESKFEQAVRRAAMMMFHKLNPDGKKTVGMSEMLDNVNQVHAVPGMARWGSMEEPQPEE